MKVIKIKNSNPSSDYLNNSKNNKSKLIILHYNNKKDIN